MTPSERHKPQQGRTDAVMSNVAGEPRKLALVDWDGVMQEGFLLLRWCKYLESRSAFDRAHLDELLATASGYENGAVSYAELAGRAPSLYVQGLNGSPVELIESLAREYTSTQVFQQAFTSLADALTSYLLGQRHDVIGVTISGAPEVLLRLVARERGLTLAIGVTGFHQGGRFNGQIFRNPATKSAKASIVETLTRDGEVLLGVGDSASDEPLLQTARRTIVVGTSLRERWDGNPDSLWLASPRITLAEKEIVESWLHALNR
jgi:phosphoserine phosphatase